jgi:hypothetical protein
MADGDLIGVLMALPAEYPLKLYQGDAWHMTIRVRERIDEDTLGPYLDLTDVTPMAQIRNGAGELMADVTCELGDQEDPDELGMVRFSLLSEDTTDFPTSSGSKWDFQLDFGGGEIRTYLRGNVTVSAEVTKAS